jgi:predicted lipoprotein with Yx(FWY)xxD motif
MFALVGAASIIAVAACSNNSGEDADNAKPAAASSPTPIPVGLQVEDSAFGKILADQQGQTLYAFTDDKKGDSACATSCLATWPALLSEKTPSASAGVDQSKVSTVVRTEGTNQVTYNNWLLYYYVGDVGPGDVDGQAVDGKWFMVGEDGKLVTKTDPS